jgi:hypothetical protein
MFASPRCVLGSMEGKKEILDFLVHISLFKIRDTPSFVIKEIRMLVWRISDYASKGRHTLMGCISF